MARRFKSCHSDQSFKRLARRSKITAQETAQETPGSTCRRMDLTVAIAKAQYYRRAGRRGDSKGRPARRMTTSHARHIRPWRGDRPAAKSCAEGGQSASAVRLDEGARRCSPRSLAALRMFRMSSQMANFLDQAGYGGSSTHRWRTREPVRQGRRACAMLCSALGRVHGNHAAHIHRTQGHGSLARRDPHE